MQEIVDFAVRHNLYLISDEIYDRLTYDGTHTCVAALPGARDRTILLNGFSKAYAMTGWRVGYVCAPPEVLNAMYKIHSYTIMCVPTTSQKAAIEALKSGEPAVRDMVGQYNQRRRLIVDGLNHAGLECHLPQGAFYAFPQHPKHGLDFRRLRHASDSRKSRWPSSPARPSAWAARATSASPTPPASPRSRKPYTASPASSREFRPARQLLNAGRLPEKKSLVAR